MKLLFIVNGLGLGNSSRCHAIVQRLSEQGVNVHVVSSGNGSWYFSEKPEIESLHEIEALTYGSSNGQLSIASTFAASASMLAILKRNAKKIGGVLDEICPDAIVVDSDYNFLPAKQRGIPIIALNNADVVWDSYFRFKDTPSSIRAQFFGVEMFDFLYHKLVPDLVISPSLDPMAVSSRANAKFVRTGPIVRKGFQRRVPAGKAENAVVMLSGSAFGTPVTFSRSEYPVKINVIGRTLPEGAQERPEVAFHGKIRDTLPLLDAADIVVVNGGFSAVSEVCWMGIPVVVVPVARHAEQWVNAKTVEILGLGRMASESTYEAVMLEMLDEFDRYRQAHLDLPPFEDGASQAAQAIIQFIDRKTL